VAASAPDAGQAAEFADDYFRRVILSELKMLIISVTEERVAEEASL
jgi:hypothetical protein